jgi:hypothetical protein
MISAATAIATMVLASGVTIASRRRGSRSVTTRDLMMGAMLVGVAAAVLLGLGRVPKYAHGPLRLYTGDVHGDENSQQITDPYTLTHVTHGILFYALLRVVAPRASLAMRGLAALAIESTWEVVENTDAVIERYRTATMAQGYYGDSVVNSLGDIGAMVVGFCVAATLPVGATASVAIALELLLLVWIRDNLLLNVVMLLAPSEGLRRWQRGA